MLLSLTLATSPTSCGSSQCLSLESVTVPLPVTDCLHVTPKHRRLRGSDSVGSFRLGNLLYHGVCHLLDDADRLHAIRPTRQDRRKMCRRLREELSHACRPEGSTEVHHSMVRFQTYCYSEWNRRVLAGIVYSSSIRTPRREEICNTSRARVLEMELVWSTLSGTRHRRTSYTLNGIQQGPSSRPLIGCEESLFRKRWARIRKELKTRQESDLSTELLLAEILQVLLRLS